MVQSSFLFSFFVLEHGSRKDRDLSVKERHPVVFSHNANPNRHFEWTKTKRKKRRDTAFLVPCQSKRLFLFS